MDDKLKLAVRTIVYRENGRVTLSKIISTLRIQGWVKLGSVEDFEDKCTSEGFKVEHLYKIKDGIKVKTRTFISIDELANTV